MLLTPIREPTACRLLPIALAVLTMACGDTAAPPPPAEVELRKAATNSGDGQTDTLGATLADPLRVVVLQDGRPVAGVAVSWSAGTGIVSPTSATTDPAGVAQTTWTLGETVGEQVAGAFLPAADTAPAVAFTAIARPGAPTALVFRPGPANAFVGRPFIPLVRVAAVDRRGNVATDFQGVIALALASAPTGGSLSGATTVDAVEGVATFADLHVAPAGPGYVLAASAAGLPGIASVEFEIVAPGPGRLAFWSDRDGNAEIYTMRADGTGLVRHTDDAATDQGPAWSADGARIAFNRDAQIYVMGADGSGTALLTEGSDPAWSSDGTRIAGSRLVTVPGPCRPGPCRVRRIFVMDLDRSDSALLTRGGAPAWSPDGRIALVSGSDIVVVNADGTGLITLLEDAALDDSPAWSPDGTTIAFRRNRSGVWDLYLMNADGTDVRALTNDPATEGRPAWSPDGASIAFASDRDGDFEIYIMRADGSGVTQVTADPAADGRPAWSP